MSKVEKLIANIYDVERDIECKLPTAPEIWKKNRSKWIENLGIHQNIKNCKLLFVELDKIVKQIITEYTNEEKIEVTYFYTHISKDFKYEPNSVIRITAKINNSPRIFYLNYQDSFWIPEDPKIYCIKRALELFYKNEHQFINFTFSLVNSEESLDNFVK